MKHIVGGLPAWIAVLAVLILVPGCNDSDSTPKPTVPQSPNLGAPIFLAPGESAVVGGAGLVVGFSRVTQDSRCPEGGECVWQGDASARLWAELPGQERSEFTLHTFPGFQGAQVYGKYRIGLNYLDPYPKTSGPIDPADYRVTLYVTTD